MPYQKEFPDFDPATMPAIPGGFSDISWKNDAMPSFECTKLGLVLWIDFLKPEDRETPGMKRFMAHPMHSEGRSHCFIETDDWAEMLAWLEGYAEQAEPKPPAECDPIADQRMDAADVEAADGKETPSR